MRQEAIKSQSQQGAFERRIKMCQATADGCRYACGLRARIGTQPFNEKGRRPRRQRQQPAPLAAELTSNNQLGKNCPDKAKPLHRTGCRQQNEERGIRSKRKSGKRIGNRYGMQLGKTTHDDSLIRGSSIAL